jgi:hypothetical protein
MKTTFYIPTEQNNRIQQAYQRHLQLNEDQLDGKPHTRSSFLVALIMRGLRTYEEIQGEAYAS